MGYDVVPQLINQAYVAEDARGICLSEGDRPVRESAIW